MRSFAKGTSLILIACVLLLLPLSAFAEDQSEILVLISTTLKDVVNAVVGKNFADKVKAAALALSGNVTGIAMTLAGVLTLLSLIWGVMLAMLEKKSVVTAAFEALLFGVIAAALIKSFALLANTVYDLAMAVLNAVGLNVGETFVNFIKSIFDPVGKIFKAIADQAEWSWSFVSMLGDAIFAMLILLVAAWFLIQAASSMMGVFIMGPIFVGVGIVVGPVMCATLASAYTRQWFSQWLNFLVGASFLTVTSVVVMKLLTGVFETAFTALGGGKSSAVALGIAMIAAGLSKLFEAIPNITDAIFPGRTGAGSAINTKAIGAAANPANHVKTAYNGASTGVSKVKSVSSAVSKFMTR
jgi:type IV secretory pathway VirB6-like protein